ncbi:hypothetical protein BST61_g6095 [Cercospora zeina]
MTGPLSLDTVAPHDLEELAEACHVATHDITHVYRCTPLQRTVLAGTQRYRDAYCYRGVWKLGASVDTNRFLDAINRVANWNSILRTRIADSTTHGLVQVVLRNAEPADCSFVDLAAYLEQDRSRSIGLGDPLARWALVDRTVALTIHHAAYDFTSIKAMNEDCLRIYHGQEPIPRPPFGLFAERCMNIDESAAHAFWRPRFSRIAAIFPEVDAHYAPRARSAITHRCRLSPGSKTPVTLLPVFVEAAWAYTSSIYTGEGAVAYGLVFSGRSPQLGDLATTLGPTVVTIPVQVNVDLELTITGFIKERAKERRQAVSNAALHYDISKISRLSADAERASQFQTVLNIITTPMFGGTTEEMQLLTESEDAATCALVLRILVQDGEVVIDAGFDSNVVCERQMRRTMQQFDRCFRFLLEGPQNRKLKELAAISTEDWKEVSAWNASLPEPTTRCLHTIVHDLAQVHPDRSAVEAWDRDATYSELDTLATQLAYRLLACGIRHSNAVLIHMDRSCWAIIAILATLKAGGCCVPLALTHPRARKDLIAAESKASIVIVCGSADRVDGLVEHTIVANEVVLDEKRERDDLPSVRATDLAYLLFTSGSTGTPKGVMLEHQSIATSLTALGVAQRWGPNTRSLHFSSLVWDASISDIFGALMFGGCVCVPSSDDRDANLAAYITMKAVNWAPLTPLVLRTLSPEICPTLESVQSVGEALDPNAPEIWKDIHFSNGWGVSEASIQNSVNIIDANCAFVRAIGRPLGCALWIVDPQNSNRLMPIGAVGEILIEGTTVARGYLNNEAKQAEVFIGAPSWAPARPVERRFYRTGDLARYYPDGSIDFLGRKDYQVKIRSQRFELEEVESTVLTCSAVREVAVTVQKNDQHQFLVAVVALTFSALPHHNILHELSCDTTQLALDTIREEIKHKLPHFMIPTHWIVVERLPQTLNAKVDRGAIKKWLAGREFSTLNAASTEGRGALSQPRSGAEIALRQVWASVLAVPVAEIGLESSFANLGGDSISAMQVATRFRKKGYRTTVAVLLGSMNLAEIASQSEQDKPLAALQGTPVEGRVFPPSPVQKLMLEHNGPASNKHFNQSWLLELRSGASPERLEAALKRLVQHHAALRTTFALQADGTWTSKVVAPTDRMLRFQYVPHLHDDDLPETLKKSQKSFDFDKGPLFGADLIELRDGRRLLFIAAHHLAVDIVSWNVIWEQIDTLLADPDAELLRTCPFGSWTEHLCNLHPSTDALSWPLADRGFWGMEDRPALVRDNVKIEVMLNYETSQLLLTSANDAFKTGPVELLLSAVLLSFQQSFPDRGSPALYVESHGRATNQAGYDLTGTVGWFTTLFPITLTGDLSQSSCEDLVPAVKEVYREASSAAVESFARKMYGAHPLSFRDIEICFNFIGRMQQIDRKDGILSLLPDMLHLRGSDYADDAEQHSLITINAMILDGHLCIGIDWNRQMARQDQLRKWVDKIQQNAAGIANLLSSRKTTLTRTEMPLLERDEPRRVQQGVNRLGIATDDIEAVHPVSAVQEGILIAQAKSSDNVYMHEVRLKVAPAQDPSVDIKRLHQAWVSVCRTHSMLRSIFVSGVSTAEAFVQVVLKNASPSVSYQSSAEHEDITRTFTPSDPPHHLVIRKVPHSGEVYVSIYSSHALLDAAAMTIVVQDLARAYTSLGSVVPGMPFVEYLRWARARKAESREYWKTYLAAVKPCRLPEFTSPDHSARCSTSGHVDTIFHHADLVQEFCKESGVTLATFIQLAWAIVLRWLTGTDNITFGYAYSGRDAFDGAEETVGPLISMLIARLDVRRELVISDLLQQVKSDLANGMAHSACSLASIQDSLGLGSEALFNTALSIQHDVSHDIGAKEGSSIHITPIAVKDPTEYAVVLQVRYSRQVIRARLEYQPKHIPEKFASEIMERLASITRSLAEGANGASVASIIGDRNILSVYQTNLIKRWNAKAPQAVAACLHDRVRHMATLYPHAPSVCFGNYELNYAELDDLSDRLAIELHMRHGVQAEQIVPFLCGKGLEAVVFMLAIIKAGAAILGLDVNHPDERIDTILKDAGAPFIIAHSSLAERARHLSRGTVVAHDMESIRALHSSAPLLISVDPAQLAYCIYTSGSTGKPKGILIQHSNIVTSLTSAVERFGIHKSTRTLQISSFAFDMSIWEVFQSLLVGGCICMPTEQERMNDLEGTITRMRVNIVYTTPSVAEVLNPDQTPTLETLSLGGEALTMKAVSRWNGRARLFNSYGPAEATPLSSCVGISRTQIANIGLPFGCRFWVVDEHDHDQLVPMGRPGELLIEGPNVSRGYINDPENTARSFIAPPIWTKDLPGLNGLIWPFYKTGDLVVQNADGSVAYMGRKDHQVKLLGHRIELSGIESHLRRQCSDWYVCVELIHPKQSSQSDYLAVFITRSSEGLATACDSTSDQPLPAVPKIGREMHEMLSTTVPSYMVPGIYIPVSALPLNSSGKTDRKRLRAMAELLTAEELVSYNALTPTRRDIGLSMEGLEGTSNPTSAPSGVNGTEATLRQLWSQILSIPVSSIHADSEWMSLGGNSFKTIQLVSAARGQGLSLTVADVFRSPRLDQLSNSVSSAPTGSKVIRDSRGIAPFSLLSVPVSAAREEAARLCGVHVSQVEDMYPCTPLQQALLAVSSRRAGEFVGQAKFKVGTQVAVGRLQRAWAKLVEDTPVLRTRIVDIPGQGLTQVVVDQPVQWSMCEAGSLEPVREMHLGSLLSRVGIYVSLDEATLIWTAHHAVYDGWSLPLLFEDLEHIYYEEDRQPNKPYREFVHSIANVTHDERGASYWREEFAGLAAPQWPSLPSLSYEPLANTKLQHQIQALSAPQRFTLPTAIRAAWAALICQYTAVPEAVFGIVSSGRQADLAGIEHIRGPVLATVPVRIAVDPQWSAEDLLVRIQEQSADMTEWEQTGLVNIQQCSPEARLACRFQSLLVIQSAEQQSSNLPRDSRLFSGAEMIESPNGEGSGTSTGFAIVLECEQTNRDLNVLFRFDAHVVSQQAVTRIAQQFESILRRLCDHSVPLSDREMFRVASAGEKDLADIWKWNASVPRSVDNCVHHMLEPVFARRKTSTAIDAWDGRLTYSQLDVLTSKLSRRLVELGVRPNTYVPLFFEKSMWNPVAALAVMKAGAASVMLDMSQPADRIKSMMIRVRPILALTSIKQVDFARGIIDGPLMIIDQSHIDEFQLESEVRTSELVQPTDTLYVAFTSGSTGQPKGIVTSHANFCSALQHQAHAIGMTEESRTLNVSSYAWDMNWYDLLHTFYAGGCLCIPSNDWKDDLSEAVLSFKANFIVTTPTIANFLNDSALESLEGIELMGEKPSAELLARLQRSAARCRNTYGPTECSASSCGSTDLRHPSHIGIGVGLVPWIVEPTSRNLVPIGCVGELWLEGPLVAQGYLHDDAQTSEAFVNAADWLRSGFGSCPGRRSRMYRTGDLVRYEDDGTLSIIGRDDGQIKIRGQRLELAEVEHHVKRHLAAAGDTNAHVIVEPIVNPETGIVALNAFIIPSDCGDVGLMKTAELLLNGINDTLLNSLPSYMVPSAYKALAETPLTQSGKTDRRQLRELAASLIAIEDTGKSDIIVTPANEVEVALRDVCAETLSVCKDSVSVTTDWTQLGGDSITAMQAVSRARQRKLNLTIDMLMRGDSLREVAACLVPSPGHHAKPATVPTRAPEPAAAHNTYFELSPVQQWYFEHHPARINFDVPVYLRLKREIESATLQKAMELVISRHSMLRARFEEDAVTETWRQFIVPDVASSYEMHVHRYVEEEEIAELIRQSRERINAETGPLTVVNVFHHPDNSQTLFFSTHHWAMDFMSWRIVEDELQEILSGRPLPPVRSSEYRDWIRALKKFSEENLHPDAALPNNSELATPHLDYWNLTPHGIKSQRVIQLELVLDHSTSAKLLKLGRKVSQISLHEMIVASLLYSFGQAFPGRATLPPCFCAGHGRDFFDDAIDVGQTVGWFTSTIPVQLPKTASRSTDLLGVIRATKAATRSLPYKGWGFTPSRYFHPIGRSRFKLDTPELCLNFTGTSLQQLESDNSLFTYLEMPKNSEPQSAQELAPMGVFTIAGHVRERRLHFMLISVAGQESSRVFMRQFEKTLREVSLLSVSDI